MVWVGLVCSEAAAGAWAVLVLGEGTCSWGRGRFSPGQGCEWGQSWVYNKPACQSGLFHPSVDASGFKHQAGLLRTTVKMLFCLKRAVFSLQTMLCGLLVNSDIDQLSLSSGLLDFALLVSEVYYRFDSYLLVHLPKLPHACIFPPPQPVLQKLP